MSEHFITKIEIKNFKCFENFKAEGFKRVNLIAGKNNVGKTTLLEALYINANGSDENWFLNAIFKATRTRDNFFVFNNILSGSIIKFYQTLFTIKSRAIKNHQLNNSNEILTNQKKVYFSFTEKFTGLQINYQLDTNKYKENVSLATIKDLFKSDDVLLRTDENVLLSRPIGLNNETINEYYGEVQKLDREDELNTILNYFDFNIEKFKIMDKEPKVWIKTLEDYLSITQVGDGVKKLVNIFVSLYRVKDGLLLLDEIENGIHYSNLDALWRLIINVAEEQNVQVFATTHSKECIESYARVAKRLEEEQAVEKDSIAFMEMGRNDENQISSIIYDSEAIYELSTQNQEIRGW